MICFAEITSRIDVKIEVRIQEEASKRYLKRLYEARKRKSSDLGEVATFKLVKIKQYK